MYISNLPPLLIGKELQQHFAENNNFFPNLIVLISNKLTQILVRLQNI